MPEVRQQSQVKNRAPSEELSDRFFPLAVIHPSEDIKDGYVRETTTLTMEPSRSSFDFAPLRSGRAEKRRSC